MEKKLDKLRRIIKGTECPLNNTKDFRPGNKALQELGIRSPLKEARLTKNDIRKLSKDLGLPNFNKPAPPCLATRIPYGDKITEEKLRMINEAEEYLLSLGFSQIRVRHHKNTARIEVPQAEIPHFDDKDLRNQIISKLKSIGYTYVSLDLEGYRTGSMNATSPNC